MWLLDVNLPNGLVLTLKGLGLQADTTAERGWRSLGNGDLAEVAFKAGFRLLLTRDRAFAESAGKALQKYPELSVVIIRIPQARETAYLKEFEAQWKIKPIRPSPGSVIDWP